MDFTTALDNGKQRNMVILVEDEKIYHSMKFLFIAGFYLIIVAILKISIF